MYLLELKGIIASSMEVSNICGRKKKSYATFYAIDMCFESYYINKFKLCMSLTSARSVSLIWMRVVNLWMKHGWRKMRVDKS